MEIITRHHIFYSNVSYVPIGEIASSLLALENIVHHSPHVLERIFVGVTILETQVYIDKIQSGSLYEDIIVKFIFGGQARFDQTIEDIRNKLGMNKLRSNPQILTAIILSLVLMGGIYSVKKYNPSKPENIAKIEINNNNIISIGAEMAGISAHDFKRSIIESMNGRENKIAKNAVNFVRPAKSDPNSEITIDNHITFSLNQDTIRAMPESIQDDEEDEIVNMTNVELVIRATDLDSYKKGWAAIVPVLGNKRIRLQLAPTVKPDTLLSGKNIYGNVAVLYRHMEDSGRIPRLVYLKEIIIPDNATVETSSEKRRIIRIER